ncbi:MobV family relaxase [Marichromatium sp. AB32]|uniref:MobV family relaxase n=1 Tax=Marichromatium sp. AB32 TaxID=2483363 RepID=UPI000F418965|nr:MobV family relaxase [Marichromatium sp. AB32]RNE88344.1 plasmid recombination enzyme [Marichromatium sp. AB32]
MPTSPRFAILRTQKLKHLASIRRSLKHAFREQETPNADLARTPDNSHIGATSSAEALAAVADRLPEKRRKDAVLAIEYLITASPEAMRDKSRAEQDAYFRDSLDWLKARHGADNVVYAGIHRDETTPHMYAYAVPLDAATGRLNAKRWLGGAKALSQMQSDFAEHVGQRHGLERGLEGSRARHQRVQAFYAALETSPTRHVTISPEALTPRVLEKKLLTHRVEDPAQVAARLTAAVHNAYQPTTDLAAVAAQERRRAAEAVATARHQRDRLETLQKPFQGLSREQVAQVLSTATTMQRENAEQRAQSRRRGARTSDRGLSR